MDPVDPAVVIWIGFTIGIVSFIAMLVKLFVTQQPGAPSLAIPAVLTIAMVGMSFWGKIKISAPGGVEVELVRELTERVEHAEREVAQTKEQVQIAAAVGHDLVTQIEEVTTTLNATQAELGTVTRVLEQPQSLQASRAAVIRERIDKQPLLDTTRLKDARINLSKIRPK